MKRSLPWVLLLVLMLTAGPAAAAEQADPDPTALRGDAYYHLLQAKLLVGEGRVYKVLNELREAVAIAPESAELKAQSAMLLMGLGQGTEAERMARGALELAPGNRDAVRVLADLAARDAARNPKSRDEAIRLFKQLAEDPEVEDEVLLILAQLAQSAGDRETAIDAARRLVSQRPGDSMSVRLLAQSLLLDARYDEALQTLIDHLMLNPESEELFPRVEELAQETGQWSAMVELFSSIFALRPDSPVAARILGRALLMTGQPAAAVPALERAVELDPENPGLKLSLANAYWRSKRLADAAELALRLSDEYPGGIDSRWILGEALADQANVDGAIEAFRSALDVALTRSPEERDGLRIRMADLLLDHDRDDEAWAVIETLEDRDADEGLQIRGRAAVRGGDLARARKLAQRLRERDRAGSALLIEAEIQLEQGRPEAARAPLQEAIDLMGRDARLWVDRLLQQRGEHELQESFLREWVELEPANPDARFQLGSLLDREGHHEVAEVELRRVIELDANHAWALNHLGYSLADRDLRLDEALALVRRALDLDPYNGAYLDSLGWVYYRMGRYDEALAPIISAARDYPHDPVVLDHLGDVHASLGNLDSAITAWRGALDNGALDPGAIEAKLSNPTQLMKAAARTETALQNQQ